MSCAALQPWAQRALRTKGGLHIALEYCKSDTKGMVETTKQQKKTSIPPA